MSVSSYGGRGFRDIRNRGEHGVDGGFARRGSSGPIPRNLLLKNCKVPALARFGAALLSEGTPFPLAYNSPIAIIATQLPAIGDSCARLRPMLPSGFGVG
jgi:hypothetical protein